jgi:hypothetical protein
MNHQDKNVLAWRNDLPDSPKAGKIVRSPHWEASCIHARSQIESWDLKKNEATTAEERLRKIQQSVHDVLRKGCDGPNPAWYMRWGYNVSGEPHFSV